MSRTGQEIYQELSSRLDQRRQEVETLRERVRSLEADTASLHGFGAAIRWLVPSALSLIALVIVLFDRYSEPEATAEPAEQLAEIFVSASGEDASPWKSTGIQLVPGRDYTIAASGRSTMAIHHIVGDAETDIPPRHPWLGPNGIDRAKHIPPSTPNPPDEWRLKYLLLPEKKGGRHGMLLAYVGQNPPPVRVPHSEILAIGRSGTISPDKEGGELWLAINEVWLDPETINALIADPNEQDSQRDRFREMLDKAYYKAWYDDNAGGYLVRITDNGEPGG